MAPTAQLPELNIGLYALGTVAIAVTAITLSYVLPFLSDPKGVRAYPGPWLAKFSCLCLARTTYKGDAQTSVMELHQKYGLHNRPFRISPNEVSICDPEALQTIYAHSLEALQSPMYDAFAPFGTARSVFTTISREDHARKRKIMSHTPSAKSLAEFASVIYEYDRAFVQH
ncbi:hypothetical protein BC835DRAFT_1293266 [Cytidiella melzeri]|nr:hypothetical protein BC835DRAFT_1293266 [Cytidiella melzeri]